MFLNVPTQVTGCINPAKSLLDPADEGGQLDVRYPNGAQCTFGGYGASFIELCVASVTSIALPAPMPYRSSRFSVCLGLFLEWNRPSIDFASAAAPRLTIRSIATLIGTGLAVKLPSQDSTRSLRPASTARRDPRRSVCSPTQSPSNVVILYLVALQSAPVAYRHLDPARTSLTMYSSLRCG